jgi:hypothetical protein
MRLRAERESHTHGALSIRATDAFLRHERDSTQAS